MSALPRWSWRTGQAVPSWRPVFTEEDRRNTKLRPLPAPWPPTARPVEFVQPSLNGTGILTPFIEANGLDPAPAPSAEAFKDLDDDDWFGFGNASLIEAPDPELDRMVDNIVGPDPLAKPTPTQPWYTGNTGRAFRPPDETISAALKDQQEVERNLAAVTAWDKDRENLAWADNRFVRSLIETNDFKTLEELATPEGQAAYRQGAYNRAKGNYQLQREQDSRYPTELLQTYNDPRGGAHPATVALASLFKDPLVQLAVLATKRFPHLSVEAALSRYTVDEQGNILYIGDDYIYRPEFPDVGIFEPGGVDAFLRGPATVAGDAITEIMSQVAEKAAARVHPLLAPTAAQGGAFVGDLARQGLANLFMDQSLDLSSALKESLEAKLQGYALQGGKAVLRRYGGRGRPR